MNDNFCYDKYSPPEIDGALIIEKDQNNEYIDSDDENSELNENINSNLNYDNDYTNF
jgi:hypothetical protein